MSLRPAKSIQPPDPDRSQCFKAADLEVEVDLHAHEAAEEGAHLLLRMPALPVHHNCTNGSGWLSVNITRY